MSINNSKANPQPSQLRNHAHAIANLHGSVNNLQYEVAYQWQDDCINEVNAVFDDIANYLSNSSSALDVAADDIVSTIQQINTH